MSDISVRVLSSTNSFFKISWSFFGPAKLKLKHRLDNLTVGESCRLKIEEPTSLVVACMIVPTENEDNVVMCIIMMCDPTDSVGRLQPISASMN